MNLKDKNIKKVSALVGLLSVGFLSCGYFVLNKDVTLINKGKEEVVSTHKLNVEDFLEEQGVSYDGNDIINVGLNDKLSDGMKIEVIEVREETVKKSEEIPFEVSVEEDSSLLKGTTEVEKEGKKGTKELTYKRTYHNGKKVDEKFVKEVVLENPVGKVVKKGTKVELVASVSRGTSTRSKSTTSQSSTDKRGRHMSVVATAYSGDSITSTGTKPRWGVIAVDPSVIPYGTKVYIPQFNKTFIAEDCGGAIKGNKIDIFMEDSSKVPGWGRRTIDIYIVS